MLKGKMVEMKRELEDGLLSFVHHVADLKNEFKDKAPFAALDRHRDDGPTPARTRRTRRTRPKDEDGMPDVVSAFAVLGEYRVRLKE